MTDTIDLLETIGSDASLRYASADELKGVLDQTRASDELAAAVIAGDGVRLRVKLGLHQVPQSTQINAPGYQEEEEQEEDVPQPESPLQPQLPSSSRIKEVF